MVLRTEAVRRRLTRLEEIQTTLAALDYEPSSPESAWAVERGLHLAAECIFDIGNHILSAGRLRAGPGRLAKTKIFSRYQLQVMGTRGPGAYD